MLYDESIEWIKVISQIKIPSFGYLSELVEVFYLCFIFLEQHFDHNPVAFNFNQHVFTLTDNLQNLC